MSNPKLRATIVVLIVGVALGVSVFAASRLFLRPMLIADAHSAAEELARRIGAGDAVEANGALASVVRYVQFDSGGEKIADVRLSRQSPEPIPAGEGQVAGLAAVGRDLLLETPYLAEFAAASRDLMSRAPALAGLTGVLEPTARSITVPVTSGGEPNGTVNVEIDQSQALQALTRAFSVIGIVVVCLAVLAIVAVAFAVTRGRGFGHDRRAFDPRSLPRDPLTGLVTREGFRAALADSVARATAAENQVGLIIVDLQGLRAVNDVWGHAAGDQVLKTAADRLRPFAADPAALGRIAGADFALIVPSEANAHSLRPMAGRIREALEAPYQVGASSVELGSRLGVALFPINAEDADVLFRAADTALSRAKREGNGGISFFDTEMQKRMRRRSDLERDLRQALERDEFVVFYQPQLELATGRLKGHEALVRWERPGEGILSPRDFLPIAIETGLIRQLGDWVLRKACRDAATWLDVGTVSVNFCPAQFRAKDLDTSIAAILAETGLPAERLEIEVPESLFLEHDSDVMATLHRIKALGVRIAMDDFGGGYSGLASLAHFPFDKVKIDRSFVNQVTEDADVAAIVASIVALGRSLSVDITAEWVETDEQVTMLRAAGCSTVQGFLFGGPRRDGALPGQAVSGDAWPEVRAERPAATG